VGRRERALAGLVSIDPEAPRAGQLLEGHLTSTDRVLVLGAGGWFGSVVLELIGTLLPQASVLCIARDPREHHVADRIWQLHRWDERLVHRFGANIVINLAFLTRGFVDTMGGMAYEMANSELTRRFLEVAGGPAVRLALTVSSGAAVTEPNHPYGRLKLAEERAALDSRRDGRAMVVARAYSVSGAYVRNPQDFAFSSFVTQAATGSISVLADRPTWRRYCDAGEFLAVCIRRGLDGFSGVIESGGDFVEMGELAQMVAEATGPSVSVTRVPQVSQEPSVYASDGSDWREHCAIVGFEPSSLAEQVSAAVRRNHSESSAPR